MAKNKIQLREEIDETIFDEMNSLYPTETKRSGMQTKQAIDHISLPSNFDFSLFQNDASCYHINAAEAYMVLNIILVTIANTHGFWSEITNLSVNSEILDFLVKSEHLARFGDRITSKYSIKEYEIAQSTRARSRNRSKTPKTEIINNPTREDFELNFDDFEDLNPGDDFFE